MFPSTTSPSPPPHTHPVGRPAVPLSDQTFRRKVEEWIPMGRPQTTEDMAGPSPPPPPSGRWPRCSEPPDPVVDTPPPPAGHRDSSTDSSDFSDENEAGICSPWFFSALSTLPLPPSDAPRLWKGGGVGGPGAGQAGGVHRHTAQRHRPGHLRRPRSPPRGGGSGGGRGS